MEEKDEIIISLSDVWNIIKKNAAFIIVVTLICAIGSFFITRYFIPKSYTSSIQLYVDTSNDDENKTASIYFMSKPMHRILLLHILKC